MLKTIWDIQRNCISEYSVTYNKNIERNCICEYSSTYNENMEERNCINE